MKPGERISPDGPEIPRAEIEKYKYRNRDKPPPFGIVVDFGHCRNLVVDITPPASIPQPGSLFELPPAGGDETAASSMGSGVREVSDQEMVKNAYLAALEEARIAREIADGEIAGYYPLVGREIWERAAEKRAWAVTIFFYSFPFVRR
jgi:hypothetical protein